MDPRTLPDWAAQYAVAEQRQALVSLALGLAGALLGLALWKSQSAFRQACWPVWIAAAVQLGMGSASLLRAPAGVPPHEPTSPARVERLTRRLESRLDVLRFVKLAEVLAVLTALALALFMPLHAHARGWALGLLTEGALLLAADLVAEQRIETFLELLRHG